MLDKCERGNPFEGIQFQKTLILAFEANMLSFHIIVPFFGFQPTVLPNIWYSGTRATSFFSKVLHKRRKFLEIWTFWGLFLPTSWKALMLAAFVSYDIAVLFRNKRFILNLMPQRNASKFAIILEYENPHSFFRFSFHATLFFSLMAGAFHLLHKRKK